MHFYINHNFTKSYFYGWKYVGASIEKLTEITLAWHRVDSKGMDSLSFQRPLYNLGIKAGVKNTDFASEFMILSLGLPDYFSSDKRLRMLKIKANIERVK